MTTDIALLWNVLLFVLLLGAQVAGRSAAHGIQYALSSLDNPPGESLVEARLKRVAKNQMEFMVLVISVFSLSQASSALPEVQGWVPVALIGGRTLYALVALAGVPVLRSLAWLVSFLGWIGLAAPLIASLF